MALNTPQIWTPSCHLHYLKFCLKSIRLSKKELFKGPLKRFWKSLASCWPGQQRYCHYKWLSCLIKNDHFNLVIAPEATRQRWRRTQTHSHWFLAYCKAANVPIILMYANARNKQGGILGKIYPTDCKQDLEKIKTWYAEYGIDVKFNSVCSDHFFLRLIRPILNFEYQIRLFSTNHRYKYSCTFWVLILSYFMAGHSKWAASKQKEQLC